MSRTADLSQRTRKATNKPARIYCLSGLQQSQLSSLLNDTKIEFLSIYSVGTHTPELLYLDVLGASAMHALLLIRPMQRWAYILYDGRCLVITLS